MNLFTRNMRISKNNCYTFLIFQLLTIQLFSQDIHYKLFTNEPYIIENHRPLALNIGHFYKTKKETRTSIQRELYNLKGKIKKIEQTSYSVTDQYLKDNNPQNLLKSTYSYFFDNQRNIIQTVSLSNSYTFKNDNYQIHTTTKTSTYYSNYKDAILDSLLFWRNGALELKEINQYNNKNICISTKQKSSDNTIEEIINENFSKGDTTFINTKFVNEIYNRGKLIEIKFEQKGDYAFDNTIGYLEYNEDNKLIKYCRESPDGHILESIKFDDFGNKIYEKIDNPTKTWLNHSTTWKYDKKQRIIEKITTEATTKTTSEYNYFYKNDFLNNLTKKFNGKESTVDNYQFDENKNLILYESGGHETVYKYEYDEQKNWIKKDIYNDDVLYRKYTRKINYW